MKKEMDYVDLRFNKIFIITISVLLISIFGQQASGYGGPPEQSSSGNYTVEVITDKESYELGESITFSGNVSKYDEERNLRITIFDSNNNITITQKIPVNTDTAFSHTITLNEKFSDGKYILKAQYGNSKVTVEKISFVVNSNDEISIDSDSDGNVIIPDWIKSNAEWWADGIIDDASFVQGIQFLIEEDVLKIPSTTQESSSGSNEIPSWIKNNAEWWADGIIDDASFIQGIQFMIKEGIMKISN